MKKLEGKVALLTGATRGIGAAIAERLAADGASVAINYATSKEDAEALAERIRGNGGKAKAIHADIGNPSQAKAFVDAAVKEFGRLDILVNNAGKFHIGPIGTVDEADVPVAVRCNRRWANLLRRRPPRPTSPWSVDGASTQRLFEDRPATSESHSTKKGSAPGHSSRVPRPE
jgi:NAD(P)-dependent dehydrogenase (short-subunit alcohol dehydrogenase family)